MIASCRAPNRKNCVASRTRVVGKAARPHYPELLLESSKAVFKFTMKLSVSGAGSRISLLALLLVSCQGPHDALDQSERYAKKENHFQAYWVVAQAREKHPESAELEKVYWQRRAAFLLERGRHLIFADEEIKAIQQLEKALAIDPENSQAKILHTKARIKLAARAVEEGDNYRWEEDLEEALKVYNRALSYVPEYPEALVGIQAVNDHFRKRHEIALAHDIEGTRARKVQELLQSEWHYSIAENYDPSIEGVRRNRESVLRQLSEERYERAKKLQAEGSYGAALMEYQKVEKVMKDAPELADRLLSVKDEVEAMRLCSMAEMMIRKGSFDEADSVLDKAYDLSHGERDKISGLILETRQRRSGEEYLKAKDLEYQYHYEAALEIYRSIDKAWPQGFKEVKTRINNLDSALEIAADSYQKGQEAEVKGDGDVALDLYEEANSVCPGYKDVMEKIATLRSQQDK